MLCCKGRANNVFRVFLFERIIQLCRYNYLYVKSVLLYRTILGETLTARKMAVLLPRFK